MKKMASVSAPLLTPWGKSINPSLPLSEYPRPQFCRDSYLCLNGPWEYAFTQSDSLPASFDGTITVPFSPESTLSGVGRTLLPHETLWYRRSFALPDGFVPAQGRLLLHFGAVDQEAVVWVNGRQVGRHFGGFTSFSVDITDCLQAENTLVVRVHDDTDATFHSRGKQTLKRGGMWYTPQSGIWQTVWLEAVPEKYMNSVHIVPLFDENAVQITVDGPENLSGDACADGQTHRFTCGEPLRIPLAHPHPWTPEDPWLYDLTLTLGEDRVQSYFALRKTEVKADAKGVKRLFLNNKPCFHNGLLDQGYWPDGLLTPPSDEAMIFDIQTAKELGYNMLRKHIKVEPMRWYYHCDRLGMLVWQDMINGGSPYNFIFTHMSLFMNPLIRDHHYRLFARADEQGRAEYLAELREIVTQLRNAPSIVLWTAFNEAWGQFDSAKACEAIRRLDNTRPIDHASGWHDQRIGDLRSLHVYFKPYRHRADKLGRAVILSEFGGYNLKVSGHCFNEDEYGYKKLQDPEALWTAYETLYRKQILPAIPQGLSAGVYTQLTDVEDELNGILTYDRAVIKLPKDRLCALNREIAEAGRKGTV